MAATSDTYAASWDSVLQAATRIAPYAHVTPVMTSSSLDKVTDKSLHFKCEVFQKGGSFKFRGACNAVFALDDEAAEKGVVTHSSGNHAGALALAASLRGIPAHIVVPRTTPNCKIAAVEAYGGKVVLCEPTMDAREATCARLAEETGAVLVPPYNDGNIISGQGTIALEFLQQVPQLQAIVVPISGGGMISGIAIAAKAIKPQIKIIAAEPSGRNDAADVAQCKAAGALVSCARPDTIADGLQGRLGDKTWPVVRDLVDAVVVVSEEDIVAAMQLIYERLKVVVEPSGAAGLAAVLHPAFSEAAGGCQDVGVVLCGGNIDLDSLGLWKALRGT